MTTVYPGASNPTHDLSLSDGVQTWGMRLDRGPEALREQPLTPSTLRFDPPGNFGAWEPGIAQIEQRDWSGGRGSDRFVAEDSTSARRFFDSMNAWTLIPGFLLPAPQWRLARGLRNSVQHLPGSVSWKGLIGDSRFVSARFTIGASNLAAARARVWLRRIGSPNPLFLAIHDDDDGAPGVAVPDLASSVSIADVTDVVSVFHSFDLADAGTDLLAGIDYHLVVRASALDNAANHWEIGVDPKFAGGHSSVDGDAWVPTKSAAYLCIEDTGLKRNFHFFQLGGALYAADQRANGSPSHVYINGDRGLATGGSAVSLEDADKAWIADQWAGAWVRIVKGKGANQARQIESNGVYELHVTAWDITPDITSEYAIHATDLWRDISPASGDLIDGVITSVAVMDDHALFAQANGQPLMRMRFNTALSVPAHEFDDDGTNTADLLRMFHHPQYGPQLWRAVFSSGEVSRAAPAAWGTPLTFGTGIKVGDKSQAIRALYDHDGAFTVLKADSLWVIAENDRASRLSVGLEALADSRNPAACSLAGQLLLGWGHRLFAYSSGNLTELGPNRELGLPPGRQGSLAALQPLGAAHLAVAMDAGESGTSSILVWENGAWHELMRAPGIGERMQALKVQDCPGTRPRLWFALAGDLGYIDLPQDGDSPLSDDGLGYQHEAVMISATIDMGAARLPKFLKEVSLLNRNLGSGVQINLDYQVDDQVGTDHWPSSGAFYSSPSDSLPLSAGQVHAIRFRLRLLTDQATVPPIVTATLLEGFARTPLKYQWAVRVRLADLQADRGGGLDADPDSFILWLQQAAHQARKIRLRSIWRALDEKDVVVEPPTVARQFTDAAHSSWGGTVTVMLREA
jgi:hypothetical protein